MAAVKCAKLYTDVYNKLTFKYYPSECTEWRKN